MDEAAANGIDTSVHMNFGAYYVIINPGAVSMYPMTLFDGRMDGWGYGDPDTTFFTTNGITSIEEIKMRLKASFDLSIIGYEEKEYFVNEVFVLNP